MLDVSQCPPLKLESELLMPFEVAEEFKIINMMTEKWRSNEHRPSGVIHDAEYSWTMRRRSFCLYFISNPCCGFWTLIGHGLLHWWNVLSPFGRQMPADMKELLNHACVIPGYVKENSSDTCIVRNRDWSTVNFSSRNQNIVKQKSNEKVCF